MLVAVRDGHSDSVDARESLRRRIVWCVGRWMILACGLGFESGGSEVCMRGYPSAIMCY